jgi:enamine deaminase RidA (YjgF/YER057c/UK114 family)
MWENVEALLNEGGASFDDVMQIIVYLRDTADYTIVEQLFAKKFPNTPYVITYAPVCRPQWLIEMECIAVTNSKDERFKDY